jgi:hypothetical protein
VITLAVAGGVALSGVLTWGAWLLAALFVVIASVQWLSVQPKTRG